jgi:hypothetical protein
MEDGVWDRMLLIENGGLGLSMGYTSDRWQTGVSVTTGSWQHVLKIPPSSTAYSNVIFPKPKGWENATSFDFTVYWSATTDLTNTWTLEWGVDSYTTSTTVAPNNSTELTVTPNGTGNLQIKTKHTNKTDYSP